MKNFKVGDRLVVVSHSDGLSIPIGTVVLVDIVHDGWLGFEGSWDIVCDNNFELVPIGFFKLFYDKI